MTTINETIKSLDLRVLVDLNQTLKEDWSWISMSNAKDRFIVLSDALWKILNSAVEEGLLKESDLSPLKKYYCTVDIRFEHTVEATSEKEAEKMWEKIIEDSDPKWEVSGTYDVMGFEFVSSDVSEARGW